MPDQKISADPVNASPSTQAALAGIDPGIDVSLNYRFTQAALKFWLGVDSGILQFSVAASTTLALVPATHLPGCTIVLGGSGALYSGNAATLGDGYTCKIINDTGSDITVPVLTGGTNRYDVIGHTKISAGGSASLEIYSRSGTRYVHVSGTTV